MTKIAVTCQGDNLDAPLDRRFGRAASFLLLDDAGKILTVRENQQNLQAVQGAGIQSAQHVVDMGAEVLISGHIGPKAFRVLEAAGVKIYLADQATVREALDALNNGTLEEIANADVEGHWV